MHLDSLYIKNFRILEDFEVKKLGRLNLIVGRNNFGKSTVLEALRIYAGGANLSLLTKIANEHDETYPAKHDSFMSDPEIILPFESFFTGRKFPLDEEKSIIIGDIRDPKKALQLQHNFYCIEQAVKKGKGATITETRVQIIQKQKLHEFTHAMVFHAICVSQHEKKELIGLNGPVQPFPNPFIESKIIHFPCGYVPTQFVSFDELGVEWDRIALTEYEEDIKAVLKLIEPNLESLTFIKNNNPNKPGRSAIVKIAGFKLPVPLNSMGEGMVRILQIALKVFSAKEGFLLIDEFENGLHYSIQEKVWHWLFNLAEKLNIQVFATTHSWDCIENFINVVQKEKSISGVLFRVGRSAKTSDKNKIIATSFVEADELARITKADIEVR